MTAKEIIQKAGIMRRKSREYCSNSYFSIPHLEKFLKKESVQVIEKEDLILLIEEDFDLYRLYFFAECYLSLLKIRQIIPQTSKPVILDIVGRDSHTLELVNQTKRAGFTQYSEFVRMICTDPILPSEKNADRVELANISDVPYISKLLYKTFDPLFSHLPTMDELEAAVNNEEITLIREKNELAGFAFFEKVSVKQEILRFFVVEEEFKGQNIGGALLYHQFCNRFPDTVYILWVGTYNSAQFLYEKFNFHYDGLKDYILKYGGN